MDDNIDICDFLPKYPNINNLDQDIFNVYEDNFYESLYRKKELYDLRLSRTEIRPEGVRGYLMNHQKIIARLMSNS